MDALLPLAAALLAMGGALAIVRSLGPRQRIARLLRVVPKVTVGEAIALAHAGNGPYVRIDGRIDSEAEFEDADHRPLVIRQTRIQVQRDGVWADVEVIREVVPFEIREGLDGIAIDGDAVGDGLVVMPRESLGVVGDLGDRLPDDLPDHLPARVTLELVSSVDHAVALGVPALDAAGLPRLGAGRGRPLVVSTIEPEEAMRILGAGRRGRSRLAAALVVAALVLGVLGVALLIAPGDVLGASPDPTMAPGNDTRSPGEGPGFVGALGPAFLAVVGIAILAIVLTTAYVRLTGGPTEHPKRR